MSAVKMATVGQLWHDYTRATMRTIPPCSLQYTEMRRAFYAGVAAFLDEAIRIPDEATETEIEAALKIVMVEIDQFYKSVGRGEA